MPHYHFHLHECGVATLDHEGSAYDSLESARKAAVTAARGIMCEEIRAGQLCLSCHIDIVDEGDECLLRLRFSDAVAVTGLPAR